MLHIGRNIISLIISRVLTAVILFLVYTRLLDYLGADAAGKYGLLAAYLTVFAFFVDLGMQQLVIKKVSEDKTQAQKYLTNYFGIQLLLGVGFMLIMDVIVWQADYPSLVKHSLYITAFSLLLSSMTMPFMAIINAFQKLSIIARVNFVNSCINAGLMALAIVFKLNIFFLAFIPGIISLLDTIVYAIIVHKKFAKFNLNFDYQFWKQLLVWNLPFMWLTFFSIYNRIDTLILPHLRSFTENGYYTFAYKFWDTLAFLPAVVAAALYPYFAEKLSKGETDDAKKVLTIYTRYMIAIGVPLTIGTYLLAGKIVHTFIPSGKFDPAASALWILVAAVSVLFIYVPVNTIIISQRTRTATMITGLNLFLNLGLNIVLIPKYGFVVAAKLTLASELFQLIGYTYVVKRKIISFPYFINFIKPIIAGLIMGGLIYYLQQYNLWLLIGLGGIVYALSLFVLRFFEPHDWELLRASINFRKKVEIV